MSVFIIDRMLSKEQVHDIQDSLDKLCVDDEGHYGYMHTPGLSISNGKILESGTVADIANEMSKNVIDIISKVFQKNVRLVNFGYVQMHPGSNNGLHADVSNLDGTPYPDGRHVDYSAIIYLNTMDSDFSGGSIAFPNQGLIIKPIGGMCLVFPGDMEHLHSVKTVKTGIRKNIILFFENQ